MIAQCWDWAQLCTRSWCPQDSSILHTGLLSPSKISVGERDRGWLSLILSPWQKSLLVEVQQENCNNCNFRQWTLSKHWSSMYQWRKNWRNRRVDSNILAYVSFVRSQNRPWGGGKKNLWPEDLAVWQFVMIFPGKLVKNWEKLKGRRGLRRGYVPGRWSQGVRVWLPALESNSRATAGSDLSAKTKCWVKDFRLSRCPTPKTYLRKRPYSLWLDFSR